MEVSKTPNEVMGKLRQAISPPTRSVLGVLGLLDCEDRRSLQRRRCPPLRYCRTQENLTPPSPTLTTRFLKTMSATLLWISLLTTSKLNDGSSVRPSLTCVLDPKLDRPGLFGVVRDLWVVLYDSKAPDLLADIERCSHPGPMAGWLGGMSGIGATTSDVVDKEVFDVALGGGGAEGGVVERTAKNLKVECIDHSCFNKSYTREKSRLAKPWRCSHHYVDYVRYRRRLERQHIN